MNITGNISKIHQQLKNNYSAQTSTTKAPQHQGISSPFKNQPLSVETLQAYNRISFKGIKQTNDHNFSPSRSLINKIQKGLEGNISPNTLSPNYLPSKNVVKAILSAIQTDYQPEEGCIKEIAAQKAEINNINSLYRSSGMFVSPESEIPAVNAFVDELKSEVNTIHQTLSTLNLSENELEIFDQFVSKTASTLFTMGFPESINHASQVSRKCALEASKMGGTSQEILQAAMVGWLHDPKLPTATSWSNLATHPLVASAIADKCFEDSAFSQAIEALTGSIKGTEEFQKGIVEALSINNDSPFVTNMVILHSPPFPAAHKQAGIADIAPEVEEIVKSRFKAPSENRMPDTIPASIRSKLERTVLGTGITAMKAEKLNNICRVLSQKHEELKGLGAKELYKKIATGDIHSPALEKTLRNAVKLVQMGLDELNIPGEALLSHHAEVRDSGKIAAKALIIADPMLLSPQKILLSGVEATPLGRLSSFIKSFNDNVNNLPADIKQRGQKWQEELQNSMLKAADQLTGQNTYNLYQATTEELSLPEKIEYQQNLLKTPETWGNYASLQILLPENKAIINTMADVLREKYEETANSSTEMFNV